RRLRELLGRQELAGVALHRLVGQFAGARLLIVGASAQETYLLCDRPEVSPESPVMSLRPLDRRHYDGGAAGLARCAAALGARPILITPLGDDAASRSLRQRLLAEGVDVRPLPVAPPLAERQRFLVGTQKLLKVDLAEPLTLDTQQEARLEAMAREAAEELGGAGAAIIAGDPQGMFSAHAAAAVCAAVRRGALALVGTGIGPRAGGSAMRPLDAVCLSERELREAVRQFDEGLPAVTWRLLRQTGGGAAFVTMDAEGLVAMERLGGADAPRPPLGGPDAPRPAEPTDRA